jgi:hypothetical protein
METIESLSERLEVLEHIGVDKTYLGELWRGGTLGSGLLLALLIGTLWLAPPLQAAEFTCASGDVACLINAINQANANGEANRITLRRGTYTLTAVDNTTSGEPTGLPVITSPLTIRGQRAETTIIERDTGAPRFRILSVGGTVTLQRLTMRNGFGGAVGGGGIGNGGTLSLIDCILTGNRAQVGGGLFNGGTVTITHTTFDGNGAVLFGGGLFNLEGTVTIANSTFVRNAAETGGGIINGLSSPGMATVILTNTTVAQNHAFGSPSPGGISGAALLQNTIIARNDFQFPGGPNDCSGPVTSLGNNLIGDLTGCTITLQPSDLTGD